MSRLPRIFQRIVYRHRRSLTLGYSQCRTFSTSVLTETQPVSNHLNMHAFMNQSSNDVPFMFKLSNNININSQLDSIDNSNSTNYIEFQTFNHPTIDLNNFKKHLKAFWNFVPKKTYHINEDNVTVMEFEHESKSPIYPTILVNQLNYDQLSGSAQSIINTMMDTVPNNVNPAQNENFLVSGRIWNAITIQEFDTIYKESSFAAMLSAFGIFPKQNDMTYKNNINENEAMDESLAAVSFKNGMKMVLNTNLNQPSIANHDILNVRKTEYHQSAKNIFRSLLAGI